LARDSSNLGLWTPRHATVSIAHDAYSHAIPAIQAEAAQLIAGLVLAK
jgi:hypothetical protein